MKKIMLSRGEKSEIRVRNEYLFVVHAHFGVLFISERCRSVSFCTKNPTYAHFRILFISHFVHPTEGNKSWNSRLSKHSIDFTGFV